MDRVLVRGVIGDDAPVAEAHDAVRVARDILLVGDDEDRLSRGVELDEEPDDLVRRLGVEVPGGLVGEEDARLIDQRPRDGDALALPARELVGSVVGAVGERDALERPLARLRALKRWRRE